MNFKCVIFSIFALFLSINALSQTIVEDLDDSNSFGGQDIDLVTEKIIRISDSKKIIIMTNDNESYFKGDFITIITNNQLAVRAIVAKVKNNRAGIKLIKIYSVTNWNSLRANLEVQVIRGDDSSFATKEGRKEVDEEEAAISKIQSEEDLFNETTLDDSSLDITENDKRLIKPDNLVAAYYGSIPGVDIESNAARYSQPMISWSYQFDDNIWGEAIAGRGVVNDFPAEKISTTLTSIIFRVKYTFSAPFDSYIQPYLGFHTISVTADGAGEDGSGNTSQADLDRELEIIESLKRSELVFGATILKRLVPGWFVKAELGSDIYAIGIGLEF